MTTRQGSAKTIIFGISGQIKSVTLYCHTIFWRVEGLGEGCVNITLIVSCLEWITSLWRHWFSSRKRCRPSFPTHSRSTRSTRGSALSAHCYTADAYGSHQTGDKTQYFPFEEYPSWRTNRARLSVRRPGPVPL